VESAGIRSYPERSGPDRWHNRPGVDGVVADRTQTHCPRLERLVPKVLKNRKCLDTYELLYKLEHARFKISFTSASSGLCVSFSCEMAKAHLT